MIFRNELGQFLGNGSEFFHDDDTSYVNIQTPNVIYSENDRNYIGIQSDCSYNDAFIFTLEDLNLL